MLSGSAVASVLRTSPDGLPFRPLTHPVELLEGIEFMPNNDFCEIYCEKDKLKKKRLASVSEFHTAPSSPYGCIVLLFGEWFVGAIPNFILPTP